MGDKEVKVQYSPEELKEIDRIIEAVSAVEIPHTQHDEKFVPEDDREADSDLIDDLMIETPFDDQGDFNAIDPTAGEFRKTVPHEPPREKKGLDVIPDGLDIDITDIEPMEYDDGESFPVKTDMSGIKDEGLEDIKEQEIEDISDLIHDVQEPGESDLLDKFDETDNIDDISVDEIDLEPAEGPVKEAPEEVIEDDFSISDLDVISDEKVLETEPIVEKKPSRDKSPLDQLNDLTAGEPDSLDARDISDDRFVGTVPEEKDKIEDMDLNVPDFEDTPFPLEDKKDVKGATIEKGVDMDIPDLSDISVVDAGDMPEAQDSDIPDFKLDDLEAVDKKRGADAIIPPVDEIEDVDIADIPDETPDVREEKPARVKPVIEKKNDIIKEVKGVSEPGYEDIEPLTIEPIDEEDGQSGMGAPDEAGKESIDLSDSDVKKLKKAIALFNPAIIKAVKETIINDLIPVNDTRQLVEMIISGKPEHNIHRFLEKKLNRKIVLTDEAGGASRRVITSRPEYTKEGRVRQKKLLKFTKIFGLAAFSAFLITILSYQLIYKPVMAKRKVTEGVALILSAGDYRKKPKDYQDAEDIFRYVDDNYAKDYLYGYNAYGRAYFEKAEYERSLAKLDRAFKLNGSHADTLNSLGYFYSKAPAEFYMIVKQDVSDKYYGGKKLQETEKSQLNVAINFFNRTLLLDRENVTALYGIGNAYFNQGQYLMAKKYYEDILRVKKDSVVGYSGLMNLYVERDAFAEVATLYNQITRKEMLHELPSPLLGKLAEYFLSKRKKPGSNVRIDYGVVSPKLKDRDDNTFPAVSQVLKELNKRDPSYPPLQVHYARLNKAQNNLAVMKRHLEKAVSMSPNYFDALHAMGEFYYATKDPVKAYEFLSKAVKASGNKPEFAGDDFYKQLYGPGMSNAYLGNIFYYYFDKVKFNFGDLQDELIDRDIEKLANYNIARDKYEQALKDKFESPELHYNLGRIYYLNNLYTKSLEQWLHLYEDFVRRPELMFALGNAFYHLGNLQASKGEYLKLISVLEYEAENARVIDSGRESHVRIFATLSSVYNNLGAVYQIQENDSRSSISYWKSIDHAQRINTENQFARVNMARSYKPERKVEPILDESIPYSIDVFREDMR